MNFLTTFGEDRVRQSECERRGVEDGLAHDGALGDNDGWDEVGVVGSMDSL